MRYNRGDVHKSGQQSARAPNRLVFRNVITNVLAVAQLRKDIPRAARYHRRRREREKEGKREKEGESDAPPDALTFGIFLFAEGMHGEIRRHTALNGSAILKGPLYNAVRERARKKEREREVVTRASRV